MRFELLLVFDSTDSPDKNHPCAGFALDTKPPCSEGFIHFHINPGGLSRRGLRVSVASGPAMVANNKRVQVAIVKNGLDIAGLHARA
mgnify:CR=1 FL=1